MIRRALDWELEGESSKLWGYRLSDAFLSVSRSKTKNELNSPQSKAHPPNKHPHSRNPSSRSPVKSRRSIANKSTSAPVRTETSALSGARRRGFSTWASFRVWWWLPWLGFRCLLWGSSSRERGKVCSPSIDKLEYPSRGCGCQLVPLFAADDANLTCL